MTLKQFLTSKTMHAVIIVLVLINGVVLGLETIPAIASQHHDILNQIDLLVLVLLSGEILIRVAVFRSRFFEHGWNGFDLVVVSVSFIGYFDTGVVLQSLRVLLLFRIIEFSDTMKMLTTALVKSFQNIFYSIIMIFLIFYTFAISGYYLYGQSIPNEFGSLHASFLTLFQLMVFDSFGDVAGPMIAVYEASWLFILSFLFFTAFSLINLIMGIVVNAIDDATKAQVRKEMAEHRDHVTKQLGEMKSHHEHVHKELGDIKEHVEKIKKHHKIDA